MNLASFELTDIDLVQEMLSRPIGAVAGWNLQITQLQRGLFSGSYSSSVLAGERSQIVIPDESELGSVEKNLSLQISDPSLYAAHHRYGHLLHLTGHTPTEFVGFIIPLQEKPLIGHRGQILAPDEMITLTKRNQEVDFVTLPGAEFLSVRIGTDREIQLLASSDVDARESPTSITRMDPRLLKRLKKEILHLVYCAPRFRNSQDLAAHQSWEAELFEYLALILDDSRPAPLTVRQNRCRALASQVRDYLEANLNRVVSIAEICSYFEVRPRTLHYAFKVCFGVSPSHYHRCRRLQLVRAQLLYRNPAEATVTELATERHFFHFGRFAADYKSVFGETPAQTLASRA